MNRYPTTWAITSLSEFCSFENGDRGKNYSGRETFVDEGVPFVSAGHFSDGLIDWQKMNFIPEDNFDRLGSGKIRPRDFLFCLRGSLGKFAYVPNINSGAIASSLIIIRPEAIVEDKFFECYLRSAICSEMISEFSNGAAQPNLSSRSLANFEFPLPPLPEQRRIVAKLDRLSARSAAARHHLTRTTTLATRAKQSILSEAYNGNLTADWRAAHGVHDAPSFDLASLCLSLTDGDHQAPPKAEEGIPFITISAINDGRLSLDRASRYVPISYFEALKPSRQARRGDILFSVTGSIAIPALVDTDEPFVFQRHIAILRPDRSKVSTEFLHFMLGAEQIKRQAHDVATGTAQLTIPLGGLRAFRVPLPPLAEQHEIVRRTEAAFARIDRLAAESARAANLLDRLDERLLAKAFRGELVPQDPTDEPASTLLTRLRESRATTPKRGRVRKTKE